MPRFFALVLAAGLLMLAPTARATEDNPTTGGCLATEAEGACKVSYHLSVEMPVTAWDISKSEFSAGTATDVGLGPCYGLAWRPGRWYSPGVDLCGSLVAATGAPNRGMLAVMVHVSPFAAAGFGRMLGAGNPWLFFLAPRVPVF